MKRLLIIILICDCTFSMSQTKDTLKRDNIFDSIEYDYYDTKWFTIGSTIDLGHLLYGMLISNGYDERPLIHFEDFSHDIIYKIKAQSDFKKDYSFGGSLSWKYPCRYIVLATIDYSQFNILNDIYRGIDIGTTLFSKLLQSEFIINLGYENTDYNESFGFTCGMQKVLFYQWLYIGGSFGYFFDNINYSANLHGYIIKHKLGLRFAYNKRYNLDFIDFGLNYILCK